MFAALAATAQTLNPTVEVTRSYEGKIVEADKQAVTMDVPDSLLRFDKDFDYSVFTTNYAGAADFSPYLMDMKPEPVTVDGGKLYLRLGAGYTLRPTLDFAWSPQMKGSTELNFHAGHRSYFGKYHEILGSSASSSNLIDKSGQAASGYDMVNRVGLDGRHIFGEGVLTFNAGYYGIMTSNPYGMKFDGYSGVAGSGTVDTGLHAGEAGLRLRHYERDGNFFFYDASLSGRFGAESFSSADAGLVLGNIKFDGTFGPVFARYNRLVARVYASVNTYSNMFNATVGNIYVAPRYQFERRGWLVSLGMKIGAPFRSSEDFMGYPVGKTTGQLFYPDFHFRLAAVPDRLSLSLDIEGGIVENSYYELKEKNHFFTPGYATYSMPFLDNSIENVRASIGAEGNIASKFKYSLKGGAAIIENGLLDGIEESGNTIYPKVAYQDYNMLFADLDFAYESRSLLLDGSFSLKSTNITKKSVSAVGPALFSGNVRFRYNWNSRIYAGVYADFATERKGQTSGYYSTALPAASYYSVSIPGWADLGLTGEYALTRKLSVWVQAGNLLGMSIQRNPGIAEKGTSVIGGVIFSL